MIQSSSLGRAAPGGGGSAAVASALAAAAWVTVAQPLMLPAISGGKRIRMRIRMSVISGSFRELFGNQRNLDGNRFPVGIGGSHDFRHVLRLGVAFDFE